MIPTDSIAANFRLPYSSVILDKPYCTITYVKILITKITAIKIGWSKTSAKYPGTTIPAGIIPVFSANIKLKITPTTKAIYKSDPNIFSTSNFVICQLMHQQRHEYYLSRR